MANMSYCRFENTASDLLDCEGHILDKLGRDEAIGRVSLVRCCLSILEGLGCEIRNSADMEINAEDAEDLIKDALEDMGENPDEEEEEEEA
jgi:hypothetical protein